MPPFHGDLASADASPSHAAGPSKSHCGSLPFLDEVDQRREIYMLAVIDEATGAPVRLATEEDFESKFDGFDLDELIASIQPQPEPKPTKPKQQSLSELLAAARDGKGPICDHCGALESPQWRKGPSDKPILCNACGTRFRRTNFLAPCLPSDQRKRPGAQSPQACSQEVAAANEMQAMDTATAAPSIMAQ